MHQVIKFCSISAKKWEKPGQVQQTPIIARRKVFREKKSDDDDDSSVIRRH